MRIVVAAERLGNAGGMERYLHVVLTALVARGATVHVVAREVESVPPGVTAEHIAWADEHAPSAVSACAAMSRALAAFAPDVAVAHNVMDGGIVETLRSAPRFAYHVHDHRPFCPNGDRVFPRSGRICTQPIGRPCAIHSLTDGCVYGPRRRTLTMIRRRERLRDAVAAADVAIVASRYVGERALDNRIRAERIVEIPPPLPDEAYATKAHACVPGTVLFAGRIVPQKGLSSLIRAVGLIPPEHRPSIRAFGAGPALGEAHREAVSRGVQLNAFGPVSPETLRAAFDDATLVALPSLWAEPFGYVGIEAFARGRTVAAYDVGGVGAWLDGGANGIAVPRGDEAALAGAIALLLHDDGRRTALAERGRQDAERFRAGIVVDSLLAAYTGR